MGPGDKGGWGLGTRVGGAWGQGWVAVGDKVGLHLGTRLGCTCGQGWVALGDKVGWGLGKRVGKPGYKGRFFCQGIGLQRLELVM